jgi:tetratricopeptide (TPR) repeat protein
MDLLKRNDPEGALAYFLQAQRIWPFWHGYEEDIKFCRAAIANRDGDRAFSNGQYEQALVDFRRASAIYPDAYYRDHMRAAEGAHEGDELARSVMTARGSDPSAWFIAPEVGNSLIIIPPMTPQTPSERRDELNEELYKLNQRMLVENYRFYSDALVCVGIPNVCSLDEDRAAEVVDLAIDIAGKNRELQLLVDPQAADQAYMKEMKVLHVPPPAQATEGYEVTQSIDTAHGNSPSAASAPPQAQSLKDCSPTWESYTSWVLQPKLVDFKSDTPKFAYEYVLQKDPRAVYPSGCVQK